MTHYSFASFNRKLLDINQWKIEQSNKLKGFHEAQKKLLLIDSEPVLKSPDLTNAINENVFPMCNAVDKENHESVSLLLHSSEMNKINKPQWESFTQCNSTLSDNRIESQLVSKSKGKDEVVENNTKERRKFLKRGDGLARFRMTLEDFKYPPKIYKNSKIKTHINKSLRGNLKQKQSYINKSNKFDETQSTNKTKVTVPTKKTNFSVDIYVGEKKLPKNKIPLVTEDKIKVSAVKKVIGNEPIKIISDPNLKNIENHNFKKKNLLLNVNDYFIHDNNDTDNESKRADKELRAFEILEQKVSESSFCSSSSIIDKLLEQSESLSPTKNINIKKTSQVSVNTYIDSKKNDSDEPDLIVDEEPHKNDKYKEMTQNKEKNNVKNEKLKSPKKKNPAEDNPNINWTRTEKPVMAVSDSSKEYKVEEKSMLDKYVNQFLHPKLEKSPEMSKKKILNECNVELKEGPLGWVKEMRLEKMDKKEIALKLQRKGLQDNVKQLINWDCSPRKKLPKKVSVKLKPRSKKAEQKNAKMTSTKEETEKVVFSSTLLRKRLEELEKEIVVFRKENNKMGKLQKVVQEEQIKLSKERKEFEKRMQEEREKFEFRMAEDRKKLQKDRNVFETYCKQTNNRPNRQEREEIERLKKDLEKMTETLTIKETRWAASQARLRNQIKTLEKENLRLTAECEKLQKSARQKPSSSNEKNFNAKIMRAINSELEKLKTKVAASEGRCYCRPTRSCATERIERPPEQKPLRRIKSAPNIKRISPMLDEVFVISPSKSNIESSTTTTAATLRTIEPKTDHNNTSMSSTGKISMLDSSCRLQESCDSMRNECKKYFANSQKIHEEERFSSDAESDIIKTDVRHCSFEDQQLKKTVSGKSNFLCAIEDENILLAEKDKNDHHNSQADLKLDICSSMTCSCDRENKQKSQTCDIQEKVLKDGTKEFIFPNGNVKKVFPGNQIVRIMYYNGDIKETNNLEGSEKYYYCETRTWHTTYKDGMELVEFPNGQTERRYSDGSSEISFPNGCVRYCDSLGRDEWRFLDGTVLKTNANGHRILLLANGQKEIQTDEFKQREYPDGTIKIIYSNGSQETRYASGRVRLKDSDGNLLMDSGGM